MWLFWAQEIDGVFLLLTNFKGRVAGKMPPYINGEINNVGTFLKIIFIHNAFMLLGASWWWNFISALEKPLNVDRKWRNERETVFTVEMECSANSDPEETLNDFQFWAF